MRDHEKALRMMIEGLSLYLESHRNTYDSPVGDDYVLGPHATDIANGLLGLLNGETGRIDCGKMDAWIRKIALQAGLEGVEQ